MAAGAGAFAWAAFPAMPTRRVYCSAVHRDGQLFVLGGCGGGGRALGAAEVLDLPTQRWTTLPPLPTPRAGAAALALGKQILVVGGVDVAQSPLASVEVYHVDEGKWEKKAALAQPSMGISAVQRGEAGDGARLQVPLLSREAGVGDAEVGFESCCHLGCSTRLSPSSQTCHLMAGSYSCPSSPVAARSG